MADARKWLMPGNFRDLCEPIVTITPMALQLTVVDAFTATAFTGNPAAIAVVDAFPADGRMQNVARELNLSETAFVVPRPDGTHDLRWFTPTVEVDLCGHATLAAAHVLGGAGEFHTRSGLLTCTLAIDGWIEMNFPLDVPVAAELPAGALGLDGVRWCGRGRYDILVELADAAAVRALEPDLSRLAALPARAVIATGAGDRPDIDCVSRVFAPAVGIPEDPVTGSAHCTLAAYWGDQTGKSELVGEQASPRGGRVRMRRAGERVVVAGQAVSVSEVTLLV
jgi:predicted PhzF superfamily epimerase YddE/YHI9